MVELGTGCALPGRLELVSRETESETVLFSVSGCFPGYL